MMKFGKPGKKPEGQWTAAGGIVPGAIHIRQDKPCQDAIKIHTGNEKYTIAAVADGHGSNACPYSSEGAAAAVEVAVEFLTSIMEKDPDNDALPTLSAHKDIWLPKQIETKWKDAIRTIHTKQSRDEQDTFSYIPYGTTLLAAAATDTFIFALQIGDGNILMIDKDGTARPILAAENDIGEDTESLCMNEAWKYVRTQIIPWNTANGAPMFLLSTDGYANSFTDTKGFMKAGADFYRIWKEEGIEYISDNLPDWLRISSDKGSGDDISLALLVYNLPILL